MWQLPHLSIEYDEEHDGRVIAEIEALPGCLVYGASRDEAARRVQALALRVIADKLKHDELTLDNAPNATLKRPRHLPWERGITNENG